MSLCRCIGLCTDIKAIGQGKEGPLGDACIGVTESHKLLCRSPLHEYCDLKQKYLFNYLLNPFGNKLIQAQA